VRRAEQAAGVPRHGTGATVESVRKKGRRGKKKREKEKEKRENKRKKREGKMSRKNWEKLGKIREKEKRFWWNFPGFRMPSVISGTTVATTVETMAMKTPSDCI
jgi:hypothetical protein